MGIQRGIIQRSRVFSFGRSVRPDRPSTIGLFLSSSAAITTRTAVPLGPSGIYDFPWSIRHGHFQTDRIGLPGINRTDYLYTEPNRLIIRLTTVVYIGVRRLGLRVRQDVFVLSLSILSNSLLPALTVWTAIDIKSSSI